jgi:hypothetical protein
MSSDHNRGKAASSGDFGGIAGWVALGVIGIIMLIVGAIGFARYASYMPPLDTIGADSSQDFDSGPAVAPNPSGEMQAPEGPHLQAFQDSCLTCHSARLPLGQPPFGREKWSEIVKKMTVVYGAPITPEAQSDVVDYILSVRPPES